MTNLKPGMILEDHDGYLFWVLHVNPEKGTVYVQDDSLYVLKPCLRVVRLYRICPELETEFKIREARPEEIDRFVGPSHLDTIPSAPNFDSLKPTGGPQTPPGA